jgi:hypothetical protein
MSNRMQAAPWIAASLTLALLAGCGGGGSDHLNWNTDAVDGSTLGSTDTSGGSGGGDTGGGGTGGGSDDGGSDGGGSGDGGSDGGGSGDGGSDGGGGGGGGSGGDSGGDDGGGDGGGTGASCTSLALCDDFEAAAAGGPPDTGRWSIGGPNCFSGAGTAVIDSSQAHSGANSVRITPGSDYCGHAFIQNSAISQLGNVRYGRFYLRLEKALGDSHVTFASMRDANDSNDSQSNELRMGGQAGIMMWNRSKDDATLPSLSPVGISLSQVLQPLTWTCIEFRVDQSSGSIQTWVDGVAPAGLQADGTATPDVDQSWINQYPTWRPALSDLKIGWEAYGGATNTVWIDDVAVGTERIGCTVP